MEHPIGYLMQTTLENIKDMVDVNTVIGEPIPAQNGATVIPVSKVSFGFLSGGGEYGAPGPGQPAGLPFAGGSGAGVSVQPIGFLVVSEEGVRVLPAQHTTALDRAINAAPQMVEDIRGLLERRNQEKKGALS